jgi:cytochrome c oxidase assembly protein subunit 11
MTSPPRKAKRNNRSLGMVLGGVAVGMVGMAFAAVPAYRLFCQVTGYDGTPRVVSEAPQPVITGRSVTVRFDATTNQGLPWHFAPDQLKVSMPLGEETLITYSASNPSDQTITGTATFNVTPLKAAQYFSKIECFCFTEQTLTPGQTTHMPVVFYVDPALADDPDMADVTTLTLSYTFFRKATAAEPKGSS